MIKKFLIRRNTMSQLIRFFHHLVALVFGYFWIPCPACGEYFGGHEYDSKMCGVVQIDSHFNFVTCPKCGNGGI